MVAISSVGFLTCQIVRFTETGDSCYLRKQVSEKAGIRSRQLTLRRLQSAILQPLNGQFTCLRGGFILPGRPVRGNAQRSKSYRRGLTPQQQLILRVLRLPLVGGVVQKELSRKAASIHVIAEVAHLLLL